MKAIIRSNVYTGLAFELLAVVLLLLKVPFMTTWFYIFAWWPLIFILDSLNYRIGRFSPIFDSPKTFFFSACVSIPVWLVFELFNLRFQNWSYHDLPSGLPSRWLGYSLAFASVIPALRELSTFFQNLLKRKRIRFLRLKVTNALVRTLTISGGLALGLCLFFPFLLFPFVWLGFFMLLDPINCRLKIDSILADAERNNGNRIAAWLLAGLVSGLLWESLNHWAGSHWEYSIPYLGFFKIFQMPLLGYGGFLPFALEIFAMTTFLDYLRKASGKKRALQTAFVILTAAFTALSFHLIDLNTWSR